MMGYPCWTPDKDMLSSCCGALSSTEIVDKDAICSACGEHATFEKENNKTEGKKMDEQKEMTNWLNTLLDYADGSRKWDTGGVFVCESHPCTPFGVGTSFDCECGGPGMPPYTPERDKPEDPQRHGKY